MLHMSQGLDEPLSLRWELVACLLVAWVLVYFAVWKSVRSSGRMLYLTATLPFVLVLVFLGRALTLDGADEGLRYFFKPVWHKLGDAKVTVDSTPPALPNTRRYCAVGGGYWRLSRKHGAFVSLGTYTLSCLRRCG